MIGRVTIIVIPTIPFNVLHYIQTYSIPDGALSRENRLPGEGSKTG